MNDDNYDWVDHLDMADARILDLEEDRSEAWDRLEQAEREAALWKSEWQQITDTAAELKKVKDGAYWERDQLVALLSKIWTSHLVNGADEDEDFSTLVCVHTPMGQATWHIRRAEVPNFAHLRFGSDHCHWDGHTTEEKYQRLADYSPRSTPPS